MSCPIGSVWPFQILELCPSVPFAKRMDKELISNPVSKAKSVVLTDAGLARAETAYRRLFDPDG